MTEPWENEKEPDQRPPDPAASLHAALAAAPPLRWPSPQRDRLWLVVQDAACTRGRAWACAMGSTTPQEIGGEDARQVELLAAMSWLFNHEREARLMDLDSLFRTVRGVAVRGKHGSARNTQADALHGMTGVAAGRSVTFASELVA
jgi:hypothetical protein